MRASSHLLRLRTLSAYRRGGAARQHYLRTACPRPCRSLTFLGIGIIPVVNASQQSDDPIMTCEPARDEYIEVVADVVDAAKCLASYTERYLEQVKSRPASELGTNEWRMYAECLERLVRDQRAAYARYRQRSEHHAELPWLAAKSA